VTAFHDIGAYVGLPRTQGLALSPDGTRLVTIVATLDAKSTAYVNAVWELDPDGVRPARRLTRSAEGESTPAFLPDSSLLFVSARPSDVPDPKAAPGGDRPAPALWQLPAGGGEARLVARRPGGVGGPVVARDTGQVLLQSSTMPGADDADTDAQRRAARKEQKVSAVLHESYPVRYWDHDLGPDAARLLIGTIPDEPAPGTDRAAALAQLRDLTPSPGRALDEADYQLSPDGRTAVTTWWVPERGGRRLAIVAIDTETGVRRILLEDPAVDFSDPRLSPDGKRLAFIAAQRSNVGRPHDVRLAVADVAGGPRREHLAGWDRWPVELAWVPGANALVLTADDDGRCPVFRADLDTDEVTRLTGDHGAYSSIRVSPDGRRVYAIRAAVDAAPTPVRIDAGTADQQPVYLPAPAPLPDLPGTLTEIRTEAADGTPLRAWLALPEGASAQQPAPLLLWIHGGPLNSWNAWAWRWNPWLPVARGYAVLLPDPALSTGYGYEFIRRGWGRWGEEPYTDLLAVTDATVARDDIDGTRTAAMGGSFGGYMANWVAGHTDRFDAVVTHASLWALDQFGPTTDAYDYWRREMTPQMALDNSPHRFVADVKTPMLVIHGDKDYRVPIGEAIRLWAELAEHSSDDDGVMPHKFLYFPDENHWVLSPQHARVWYETVFAFLAHTVLGEDWQTPDILR
jgi:dipeptidyl aminopeptidase/acylaminoacyl peptidase